MTFLVPGREEGAVPEDAPPAGAHPFSGRTAWARNLQTPLRVFLRTETGTDTAFALGMLALTGPRFPDRVRAFLLSVAVVDDLASLVVIGAVYTKALAAVPLAAAAGIFAVILILRRARIRYGIVYALLGIAAWVAVLKSGVDPVVVGLVMGLLTFAYPAARTDLERASDLFRSFR